MKPIELAQLSQLNQNHFYVAFQAPNYVNGFDYAMVLVVEEDSRKDDWKIITKEKIVNGLKFNYLAFENASYPGGTGTSGPEDDIGTSRQRLVRIVPGNNWTDFLQRFNPGQPDIGGERSLEFYAVIAVVAVAGGLPVAQLGDIVVTRTLRMR